MWIRKLGLMNARLRKNAHKCERQVISTEDFFLRTSYFTIRSCRLSFYVDVNVGFMLASRIQLTLPILQLTLPILHLWQPCSWMTERVKLKSWLQFKSCVIICNKLYFCSIQKKLQAKWYYVRNSAT